jgi:tetratricopeptide (TPR) repeat protein
MASTLRGNVQDRKEPSWWRAIFAWPAPAYAFAGIAAVAIVAWIGVRTLRPPSAEQLLAQAYSEHRTLEVRIPGAKYAPMQAERGTGRSDFDKVPSLLKAEALIGENLSKNPNDPAWLQAQARADLLDGNYEPAIKSLQRALETQPDSPALMIDLGSSYFMRAESANRPIDYGNAIESLGKALAKSPADPVALFNRALVCDRIFLYTQAVDDWEHYLRIDPQGEWADEARHHLAAVQQKLKQHEKSQSESFLSPAEIANAGADDSAAREQIDERIEQYFHVAVTNWLPQSFPESSAQYSAEARSALSKLADIAQKEHGDTWLANLLNGSTSGQFPSGVKALAMSVQANDRGDYAEGQESAHRAALQFRASANIAGELRAQAEEVYSDHLLWEGPRCLTLLSSMNQSLNHTSYTWIQAQMNLEQSNCANAVGDLGTYQAAIGRGMKQAEDHKYLALHLRALGFQALSDASVGESNTAFSLASQGLKLFWSGRVDLMKGYNLYFNLESAAEGLRLPYFQVALLREATALIDQHPDVLQRAMAHRWYGNAAYLANMPRLAASEFPRQARCSPPHREPQEQCATTWTRRFG